MKEYAILIYKIRDNIASGLEKEDAIDRAVEACIQEGILKDMLEKHRGEAREMLLTEYDEELHIKNEKQISYEEGRMEKALQVYNNCIERGMSEEDAIAISGYSHMGSKDISGKTEQYKNDIMETNLCLK